MGLSEALDLLARQGTAAAQTTGRVRFRQETVDLGARVDVADIGAVLDLLDDPRPWSFDANVSLYAVDRTSPHHAAAVQQVESAPNGTTRVGLPVQTLSAFVRIVPHPRVMRDPLPSDRAAALVDAWIDAPVACVPAPGAATWALAAVLLRDHGATGSLVPDAVLAALAIEHGVPVVSADSDFARFGEVTWIDPVRVSS